MQYFLFKSFAVLSLITNEKKEGKSCSHFGCAPRFFG